MFDFLLLRKRLYQPKDKRNIYNNRCKDIGGTKMDNLELVSFQIISAVGVAKSFYIEAMKIAEKR